jgi:hypothetical protein
MATLLPTPPISRAQCGSASTSNRITSAGKHSRGQHWAPATSSCHGAACAARLQSSRVVANATTVTEPPVEVMSTLERNSHGLLLCTVFGGFKVREDTSPHGAAWSWRVRCSNSFHAPCLQHFQKVSDVMTKGARAFQLRLQ